MTRLFALFAVLAFFYFRRLKKGPKLAREDWSLYRDPNAVAVPVRVDELLEPLRRWGYRPVLVDADDPLRARLQQEGVRHGGVLIDLSLLATKGYGTLEVEDAGDDLYTEMVKYALFELGKLLPGSTFREAYSTLTAELTDTLEPQLPEHPHYLPR